VGRFSITACRESNIEGMRLHLRDWISAFAWQQLERVQKALDGATVQAALFPYGEVGQTA
jgi:hypothetical protein